MKIGRSLPLYVASIFCAGMASSIPLSHTISNLRLDEGLAWVTIIMISALLGMLGRAEETKS